MSVEFTKDVETRRVNKAKPTWELLKTSSLVLAVKKAREMGWKEKQVQVRVEETAEGPVYKIEPFEKDCGCKGMLKYYDYFD